MSKRVMSRNVQVMFLSWCLWFSGSKAIDVTTSQRSDRIVFQASVTTPLYRFTAWPRLPSLLWRDSANELTMSVNSSKVTFTVTNHMWWSYTFLQVLCIWCSFCLYGNRSKPLIWVMFQSFSMCQMLLTETSLVEMRLNVINSVQWSI